ncbi:ATP synthase protein I [Arthrobacter sp. MP_M7]|nr:ATP synthase protein I [Arthrobacter sp. MP_M4]MEC5203332.1 ATP synthase protein I [Arthrobacter sp. MP_M7]
MISRKDRHMNKRATSNKSAGAPGVSDNGRDGGYNAGIAVFSYIVGGILVWSLIGWGLDNLWGTRWIVLAGGLLGAAGGFYLSHMHGLTSLRNPAGEDGAAGGPSKDAEQ